MHVRPGLYKALVAVLPPVPRMMPLNSGALGKQLLNKPSAYAPSFYRGSIRYVASHSQVGCSYEKAFGG